MWHCEKIGMGQSPPVTTEEEWKNLTIEVDLITQDRSKPEYMINDQMWLSAIKRSDNKETKLSKLDQNFTETELVNNETKKLEAKEAVWRDFYDVTKLIQWKKPYHVIRENGDTHNCMVVDTTRPWHQRCKKWLVLFFFTNWLIFGLCQLCRDPLLYILNHILQK